MRIIQTEFLTAVVACAAFTCAGAADPAEGFHGTGLSPQMVEYGSLWYIRGDVSFANYPGPSVICNCVIQNSVSQDQGYVGSVGMGYKFQQFVRMDATVEYRTPTRISFRSPDGSTGETNVKSYLGMVNVYVDMPVAKNITPYIGVGAGLAGHELGNVSKNGVPCPSCTPSSWDGATTVTAAWSAMAGVGYDLNANLKLDAGYRILTMGSTHSSKNTNLGPSSSRFEFKDIASHDLHVGFRYMID